MIESINVSLWKDCVHRNFMRAAKALIRLHLPAGYDNRFPTMWIAFLFYLAFAQYLTYYKPLKDDEFELEQVSKALPVTLLLQVGSVEITALWHFHSSPLKPTFIRAAFFLRLQERGIYCPTPSALQKEPGIIY